MTIPLYGSIGALFNRLGKCGLVVKNNDSFQATLQTTLIDPVDGIVAQYNTEPDLQAEVGNTWIGLLGSLESPTAIAQQLTLDTINRMVYRDNPRIGQTISSSNLSGSITEVIRQMNAAGASVLKTVTTTTPGSFVGIGTGAVNASIYRPFDGRMLENAFAETLLFTCSSDPYTGGSAAFNEGFTVMGEGSENDVFAFDWPQGSSGQTTVNAIDGDTNQGSGNLLANSGFASWTITTNVPDSWSLSVGTAGTNTQQNSSIIYSSGSSLVLIGDGATLISLVQGFESSAGNNSQLSAQTQYGVCLFLRCGGTTPSQGVLQVDLIDGNGNIINDQAGTPNSFAIDLTQLSVNWASFTGAFRLPEILPATQSIRLHLTTALPNGVPVYVDKMSMGVMTQLYTQGPFIALHSGNTPFVQSPVADYATCAITNARGAGGTLSTWQTLLYRLLNGSVGGELLWPSSLTPTIADALIG